MPLKPARAEPKIRLQVHVPLAMNQWITDRADDTGESLAAVVNEMLERGRVSMLNEDGTWKAVNGG